MKNSGNSWDHLLSPSIMYNVYRTNYTISNTIDSRMRDYVTVTVFGVYIKKLHRIDMICVTETVSSGVININSILV